MILYETIKDDVVLCKLLGETSIYEDFCEFLGDYFKPSLLIKGAEIWCGQHRRVYYIPIDNHMCISSYILAEWMARLGFDINELCVVIRDYLYETTSKIWKIS